MTKIKISSMGILEVTFEDDVYIAKAADFLKALKQIKKQRIDSNKGICGNVIRTGLVDAISVRQVGMVIGALAQTWDKKSDNPMYPVPSTKKKYTPLEMFTYRTEFWNRSTEYGKLRHELLDHCITRLEEIISTDFVQELLMKAANKLIENASKAGYVIGIDVLSNKPLAMGNITMVPSIRKSRSNY